MRFQALDSWRGIAAIGVVFFHMQIAWTFYESDLVRHAWLAVDFFFVLSGFVMAFTYGRRIADGRQFAGFMIKRLGRVWPLHAAVIVFLVLVQIAILLLTRYAHFPVPKNRPFEDAWRGGALLANLFLVHALGFFRGPGTWNTPSWSISAEFYTYGVFGLVTMFAPRRVFLVSAAISIAALVVLAALSSSYLASSTTWGFVRCLYDFFLGVILMHIEARLPKPSSGIASVLEIGMVAATFGFVWHTGPSALTLAAPVLFALVILVFAQEAGLVSRILKARPVAWLGTHSYTIYMTHFSVFLVLNHLFQVAEHFTNRKLTIAHAAERGADVPDVQILLTLGSAPRNDLLVVAILSLLFAVSACVYRRFEGPARETFRRLAEQVEGHVSKSYPGTASTVSIEAAEPTPQP